MQVHCHNVIEVSMHSTKRCKKIFEIECCHTMVYDCRVYIIESFFNTGVLLTIFFLATPSFEFVFAGYESVGRSYCAKVSLTCTLYTLRVHGHGTYCLMSPQYLNHNFPTRRPAQRVDKDTGGGISLRVEPWGLWTRVKHPRQMLPVFVSGFLFLSF